MDRPPKRKECEEGVVKLATQSPGNNKRTRIDMNSPKRTDLDPPPPPPRPPPPPMRTIAEFMKSATLSSQEVGYESESGDSMVANPGSPRSPLESRPSRPESRWLFEMTDRAEQGRRRITIRLPERQEMLANGEDRYEMRLLVCGICSGRCYHGTFMTRDFKLVQLGLNERGSVLCNPLPIGDRVATADDLRLLASEFWQQLISDGSFDVPRTIAVAQLQLRRACATPRAANRALIFGLLDSLSSAQEDAITCNAYQHSNPWGQSGVDDPKGCYADYADPKGGHADPKGGYDDGEEADVHLYGIVSAPDLAKVMSILIVPSLVLRLWTIHHVLCWCTPVTTQEVSSAQEILRARRVAHVLIRALGPSMHNRISSANVNDWFYWDDPTDNELFPPAVRSQTRDWLLDAIRPNQEPSQKPPGSGCLGDRIPPTPTTYIPPADFSRSIPTVPTVLCTTYGDRPTARRTREGLRLEAPGIVLGMPEFTRNAPPQPPYFHRPATVQRIKKRPAPDVAGEKDLVEPTPAKRPHLDPSPTLDSSALQEGDEDDDDDELDSRALYARGSPNYDPEADEDLDEEQLAEICDRARARDRKRKRNRTQEEPDGGGEDEDA